jgi:hypothetical protein
MTASKIDVKTIGHPFNLGMTKQWSEKDIEFLKSYGATINTVGFLHIPLDHIEGEVLLGIGQAPPPGPPCELRIGGRLLKMGKKRSSVV